MISIAPIADYPGMWFLAVVNLAALLVSIVGAMMLLFRRKQIAWLPISAAIILTYGLSWASKMRAGFVPNVPYIQTEIISIGERSIPSVSIDYSADLIAVGFAFSVLIALRKRA